MSNKGIYNREGSQEFLITGDNSTTEFIFQYSRIQDWKANIEVKNVDSLNGNIIQASEANPYIHELTIQTENIDLNKCKIVFPDDFPSTQKYLVTVRGYVPYYPSQEKIFYVESIGVSNNYQLMTINPDGTNKINYSSSKNVSENFWTPSQSGDKVVFNSSAYGDNNSEVYMADFSISKGIYNIQPITNDDGGSSRSSNSYWGFNDSVIFTSNYNNTALYGYRISDGNLNTLNLGGLSSSPFQYPEPQPNNNQVYFEYLKPPGINRKRKNTYDLTSNDFTGVGDADIILSPDVPGANAVFRNAITNQAGNKLLLSGGGLPDSSIFIYDSFNGVTATSQRQMTTTSLLRDSRPQWSPEEDYIIWDTQIGSTYRIVKKPSNTDYTVSDEIQLTDGTYVAVFPFWRKWVKG